MRKNIITWFAVFVTVISFAHKSPSQKEPKTKSITWKQMVKEIYKADYASVSQAHNLQVRLLKKNGTVLVAKEPEIDKVFEVIEKCKKCKNIPMVRE